MNEIDGSFWAISLKARNVGRDFCARCQVKFCSQVDGRAGAAGEGIKTRWRNVYGRQKPNFQATNVSQSLEDAHQRGSAHADGT